MRPELQNVGTPATVVSMTNPAPRTTCYCCPFVAIGWNASRPACNTHRSSEDATTAAAIEATHYNTDH